MVTETAPQIQAPPPNISKRDAGILRKYRTREVHLFIGPSGGGKTLSMAWKIKYLLEQYYILNKLYSYLIGTKYLPRPLKVWSNFDIAIPFLASERELYWPGCEEIVILKTEPLNVEKLYVFDDEMREGTVFVDELDLIADRQDWQSGGSKLLVAILRQIRKRHMSFTGSIQSEDWLNPRFYFQLDMLTTCRDSSVTGWGKAVGMEPGNLTFLQTKDISGKATGYQFRETGEIYETKLRGSSLHDIYDTDQEFNPFEHMISYSIKRKRKIIDPNIESEMQEQGGQEEAPIQGDIEAIKQLVTRYVKEGAKKVDFMEFKQEAKKLGCNMSRTPLLEYLYAAHNITAYNSCGYAKLKLDKVTNITKKRG